MRIQDTHLLVCPVNRQRLHWEGTNLELFLSDGALRTEDGAASWPVVDGLPHLYREEDLKGTDRLMRHIRDRLPPVHRPLLRAGLPLLQGGGTERALRDATLEHLRLGALRPRGDRPARVLEVGIGTGVHLPLIAASVAGSVRAEVWGTDLSETLLRRCRERWKHDPFDEKARLLLADAHHLPFPDQSFDRVFHVGGLGRFDDPQAVLDEMFRVLAPGGRLVVVAKRLDTREEQAPLFQRTFQLLTVHEPEVPPERLVIPDGAVDVVEEQVSRFFYVLGFRRPDA